MKLRTKFQDEDFDLGEVVEANIYYGGRGRFKVLAEAIKGGEHTFYYSSIKEFNEEWEDYEDTKEYWYIDDAGVLQIDQVLASEINMRKSIGNYFETKEEAELAVRKLKAWKRLKEKGFRFIDHIDRDAGQGMTRYEWDGYVNGEDLDLLFGGEE